MGLRPITQFRPNNRPNQSPNSRPIQSILWPIFARPNWGPAQDQAQKTSEPTTQQLGLPPHGPAFRPFLFLPHEERSSPSDAFFTHTMAACMHGFLLMFACSAPHSCSELVFTILLLLHGPTLHANLQSISSPPSRVQLPTTRHAWPSIPACHAAGFTTSLPPTSRPAWPLPAAPWFQPALSLQPTGYLHLQLNWPTTPPYTPVQLSLPRAPCWRQNSTQPSRPFSIS